MIGDEPYDDRDGWIWFDGRLVPWRDAQVHVLNHGLHYASAVFEGERAYGGEVFKLTEHNERLRRSAERLGFDLPWTVEEIDQACRDSLAANKLKDAYVRPIAWRGSEQMGVSSRSTKVHLAVGAWAMGGYFGDADDAARQGIRLDVSTWRRPPPECAPADAKTAGNYSIATMAKNRAEAKGYGDALMLDWRGQVAEATGANAFFVRDGALHTPTPDCFLDGITRQTVIDLACARGIEVNERAIRPEELESFEQMFLTGSAAEVTPVSEAGPWRFEVGALTMQLRRDYLDLVNGRLERRKAA